MMTACRWQSGLSIRSADGQEDRIVGLGAVFYAESDKGSEYWLWDDMCERIGRGAFDRAMREQQDCRSFFNHDQNLILGRRSSGTMQLRVTDAGLEYEVLPPTTEAARHVVEAIRRGDVSGSSFMFMPRRAEWEERSDGDRVWWIRTITDLDLYEVGPVVWPAYESTTSELRSVVPVQQAAALQLFKDYRSSVRSELERFRSNQPSARQARRTAMAAALSR